MDFHKEAELSKINIKNSKRVNIRKPVDIDGYYNSGTGWHACKIYDLSRGGAALKLNQFFIEGDEILIRIIKDRDKIELKTEVVNVNGQRIGIRFADMEKHGSEIESLISTS